MGPKKRQRNQTVSAICASLGYSSDRNKDERYRGKLSNPVRDFCKTFKEDLLRPADFSSPKEVDTLDCATAFAAKNQHLFPDTKIAQERNWPIYRLHRDRIRNGLARLICSQEKIKKKNIDYENAKAAKKQDDPSIPRQASVMNAANLHSKPMLNAVNSPLRNSNLPPARPNRIDALEKEIEANTPGLASPEKDNSDIVSIWIFDHLNFIYPPIQRVKSHSNCWLLGFGAECPPDIEAHAYRYLHDNDLYDSSNGAAIKNMVHHMKIEFNVGESGMNDEMIFTKCQSIIKNAVNKWRDDDLFEGDGFLTRPKGDSGHDTWVKTPVFESAWKTRRALWSAKSKAPGNDIGKDLPATRASEDIPRSPKRVAQPLDDESDVDLFEGWESIYRQTKRRKSDGTGSTVSPPPSPIITRNEDGFLFVNSPIPDRAPTAKMCTPRNSTPAISSQSSIRSMSTELAIRSSPARPRIPAQETTTASHPNAAMGPLKPKSTQAAPIILGLKRIPSNRTPAPGPVPTPHNRNVAFPAKKAVASEANNRRPLWFALPGPTGDPETSPNKLVSITAFKESSRSDFFKLVATRAGLTLAELAFIRFRCAWGGRKATVVNRFTTEEQWTEIKETEILERYRMAQVELPKQEKFHVWIFYNDTSE